MADFCESIHSFKRNPTREVTIGNKIIGGDHPILIQSMTTTDTMDTEGTVNQSIRMIDAGCELVRITAPSKKEAENLQAIKDMLRAKGYNTPLVADIHFTPNAAEIAAKIVEKVRVNPGNYADKKKFEEIDYTDDSYQEELERIEKKFTPLVKLCKENGVAMRIGTNHGSLSDRILSRYGDTPLGMVESAMEFLRICIKYDFHNIVLSMKASNTLVMVQAYRLLVKTMKENGMDYPLHLGVTEAGDGEDGRIKSAVGIGTLLQDGLGDTIRVSLTEEPEFEIPVAEKLVEAFKDLKNHEGIPEMLSSPIDFYNYNKRKTSEVVNVGANHVPVVVGDLSLLEELKPSHFFAFGYNYSVPLDKWNIADQAVDYLFIGKNTANFEIPGTLGLIQNVDGWEQKERHYPLITSQHLPKVKDIKSALIFMEVSASEIIANGSLLKTISEIDHLVLVLTSTNRNGMVELRRAVMQLMQSGIQTPVLFKREYSNMDEESFQLKSSAEIGALFIDGIGDGIWIKAANCGGNKLITSTAFGILQATRTRISKTEYISCPSCGRTLFDLQETTAKIRAVTSHLKGIKIGIMGCIVNGPGEMADADYGYVGTGPGKITLYKEKEVVQKNVPEAKAVDALIDLIKKHGDWVVANA
ncbi:MAG: (E)-4-hydroxy-3-methylbut-2-enyl-diphosphate synthase [Vicingaceae bacterium]|jgi:(E)-4-hydroxy-3-methylbut-2-enyl-diphosphate synthase